MVQVMADPKNITEVIEKVEDKIDDRWLSLGQIIDMFEHRGYGPLLLIAALIIVLPTGGIPGVPSVLGVAIILIAVQMILGRNSPWLPQRLRNLHLRKSTFDNGADRIKPFTRKIDRVIKPRLKYLTCGLVARFVGLACIVLAALLPFTEIVPFSDIVPGSAIALLGLGLTARDGAIVILGLAFATGSVLFIGSLFLF